MIDFVKDMLRPPRDIMLVAIGFLYDLRRFTKHGGWRRKYSDPVRHAFNAAKLYHKLEKSMAMPDRRAGAGWKGASALLRHLSRTPDSARSDMRERAAAQAIRSFIAESVVEPGDSLAAGVKALASSALPRTPAEEELLAGVKSIGREGAHTGKLPNPEAFFSSRVSVRDFSDEPVSEADVVRALALARWTPSVCNRQAWHVYGTGDRATVDLALRFQNGNKGFGHRIPYLLIITADLRAFDEPGERFQHWIDGGMFAMSVVLALHSLGIGSCCLNWSTLPSQDQALRGSVSIDDAHTVVMYLAVGYASEGALACISARREVNDFFTRMRPL